MDYTSDTTFQILFTFVLLVRFLLPFTIFRFPLAGIIGCLVVDAVDQTFFQWFGYDPPFYQSYDKAMDVFYLGIAYISTMRNWTSRQAYPVSQFLFYYRQIGVVAFELTGIRTLLLIFPNTFEYFFIGYEGIRSRWTPSRFTRRFWIFTAAFIWIFIKLPQEYWIHVAQLDFTDTWQDVSWFAPLIITGSLIILAVLWFVIRPRLDPADHAWTFAAPEIPAPVRTAKLRAGFVATYNRVISWQALDKIALISLLSIIFASFLPTIDSSPLEVMLFVGVFVILNAAITLGLARRGRSTESAFMALMARIVINFGLLVLIDRFIYDQLMLRQSTFLTLLFCVLITTYDRFRPIHDWRERNPDDAS